MVGNLSLRRGCARLERGRIIGNVVVHPNYRGRGIARALMEAAEQAVTRAEGARWLGLEVRSDNAVARTLYTHLGFQPVGEVAHLLRPYDLLWPDHAAPRSIWRRSRPEDRLLWAGLVEKTLPRLQAQVLEVRPEPVVSLAASLSANWNCGSVMSGRVPGSRRPLSRDWQ